MFVLGTAGHVDHGKSTLIRRLTGIDPDRLVEEKARGLTIDLGFAWMTLPSGREVGIVDVPGHERFIHNMLAGAGQIDAVIFVVDANEGWRPQSEEHLAILDLLGARGGVVALTKIDVARDAAKTTDEVRSRLTGTVLAHAPIVGVSAVTGDGIDELLRALDSTLDSVAPPADRERARLYVDRSFSIKGSGTVVTGTLTGGALAAGEDIEVLPSGLHARIRSIQTHKTSRDRAVPTSRVALNLAGVDRDQIHRGDAIVHPRRWKPTTCIDVALRTVRDLDHRVTSRGAYVLYSGTAETRVRLRLIDAVELGPAGSAFARLRCESPIVAAPGDRVVLRDAGRRQTVAGGLILDAHPAGERIESERPQQLRARQDALGTDTLGTLTVAERGVVAAEDLAALAGTTAAPGAIELPDYIVSREWLDQMTRKLTELLERAHAASPLERGPARESIRAASGVDDSRLFSQTLEALADIVVADGPLLRLTSHEVRLSPHLQQRRDDLMAAMDEAGFQPPGLQELFTRFTPELVKALLDAGTLVKISDDLAFTSDQIEDAKRIIREAAVTSGAGLTASEIRGKLSSSRKYVIPLLEYLDRIGFTRRDGDLRVPRE